MNAAFDPNSAPARTGDLLWHDVAALNKELLAFGQQRLQLNLARNETLLHCRDFEEAYRVQSDFASSTARQYLDESGRLMGLMTKLMFDCWTPGQSFGTRADG